MLWDERIGRRIKLKDLHTLQIIAQTGSMAKASSRLGLSQPAISKAIADMEHTLGAPLLERSSHGVELTHCGRVLLERSRVMFDELRQGVREIEFLSDPTQGEVRIGCTPPMTVFVSEVIGTLSASHPRITYDITDSDTTRLITLLRERELDIVISRWAGQASEDLAIKYLFDAPLAVLADRHNPLTRRAKLELRDLLQEKWVLPPVDGYLGRIVTDMFSRRDLPRPPVAVSTRSVHMQLNMVAGGRFLAMLPERMVRYPAYLAWLRALKIDLRDSADPVAAITLKHRRASGPATLFLQVSREVAVPA